MIEGTVGSVAAVNDAERQGSPKESAGFKIQEITNLLFTSPYGISSGQKASKRGYFILLFTLSLIQVLCAKAEQ